MTIIDTDVGEVVYNVPSTKVYTSSQLIGGDWVEAEHLWLERLRITLAPDIDQAEFSYEYGPQLKPGGSESEHFDPWDLNNHFVRVEIESTVEGDEPIKWWGQFEVDNLEPAGSQGDTETGAVDPSGEPAGRQHLVAYGLLRLLERRRIFSTQIQRTGEFTVDIDTDTIYGANSGLSEGDIVTLDSSDTLPDGLEQSTNYYAINVTTDSFQLALSEGGSAVSISDDGTGVHVWRGGRFELLRGLPFNSDESGSFYARGNRATVVDATATNSENVVYPFSGSRRAGTEWTVEECVKYTLKYDVPDISILVDEVEWKLDRANEDAGSGLALRWMVLTCRREGRTPKEVLDELIDRRRGLYYYVKFDDAEGNIVLYAGTFASEEITLPSGQVLPANEDIRSLDFENAFDITSAAVRSIASQTFDTIIVQGAFRTTTATFHFGESRVFIPDWTSDEETAFRTAATENYGNATLEEKYRLNAITRNGDGLAHVFARFRIATDWSGLIAAASIHSANPEEEYWVWPRLDGDLEKGDDGNPVPLYEASKNAAPGRKIWNQGVRIEPRLTLKERLDYSGTNIADETFEDSNLFGREDYLRPLFFAQTETIDGETIFQHVDKLRNNSEAKPRSWSASGRVLESGPQIEIRARPNQMLGYDEWRDNDDVAETEPDEDPLIQNGIPWTDLRATLTLRLDKRVQRIERINTVKPGQVERTLWITLADKRLDYVLPYTVYDIVAGTQPKFTTSGGFVRDDRSELKDIATSAANWYGTVRQTLEISYRQVRPLFPLGILIEDVGANYSISDVNTVVSAITYQFPGGRPTTSLETSYADLDFS